MNKTDRTLLLFFLLTLIMCTAVYRFADMPHNFTPVGALALFAGYSLRSRWNILIPIGVMACTDIIIGIYNPWIMASVYGSYALMTVLGSRIAMNPHWIKPILGSVAGSILFFVLTNGAVWAFGSWYPHSGPGLYECFLNALPFFRNTLSGNVFYTLLIFTSYNLITVGYIKSPIIRFPSKSYVTH